MVEMKYPELLAQAKGHSFSFCLYQCCISGFLVPNLSVVQGESLKEQLVEESFVNAPKSLFCEDSDGDELCSYGEGVFGGEGGGIWKNVILSVTGWPNHVN